MVTEVTPKKWKAVFLERLTQSPNVAAACRRARITRKTAYQERTADPDFATAWEEARQIGLDALEDKAIGRAEKESDTLMIFLLKAHRPERYNVPQRHEQSGPGGGPIPVSSAVFTTDLTDMNEDERRAHLANLSATAATIAGLSFFGGTDCGDGAATTAEGDHDEDPHA